MNQIDIRVNICIISSATDPFSLCFLDVARYYKYHLAKAGLEVRPEISKNRLYAGHVNIVFGAHMAPSVDIFKNYCCVYVNLEQLGSTGKMVSSPYLDLLGSSYHIDYDQSNANVLNIADTGKRCIATLAYAEYLRKNRPPMPLEERPIDILFYGAMNASRRAYLESVASSGVKVTVLSGLFGPERDDIVEQAKLLLNISFYEKRALEQVRIFHCLSLGTPVLSILEPNATNIPEAYVDTVFYATPDKLIDFVKNYFRTEEFFGEARRKLDYFSRYDNFNGLEDILILLSQAAKETKGLDAVSAWMKEPKVNIGSGRKYMSGWLNIDVNANVSPDVVIDLSRPDLEFPLSIASETFGDFALDEASVDLILADNLLAHVSDLASFMTNCLRLLREQGRMVIIVPWYKSNTAWQDPAHVHAFNENSWIYYADWFWCLGWFEHRFSVLSCEFLNLQEQVVTSQSDIYFMRVNMEKIQTSSAERNIARLQRADFGPLPNDQ